MTGLPVVAQAHGMTWLSVNHCYLSDVRQSRPRFVYVRLWGASQGLGRGRMHELLDRKLRWRQE